VTRALHHHTDAPEAIHEADRVASNGREAAAGSSRRPHAASIEQNPARISGHVGRLGTAGQDRVRCPRLTPRGISRSRRPARTRRTIAVVGTGASPAAWPRGWWWCRQHDSCSQCGDTRSRPRSSSTFAARAPAAAPPTALPMINPAATRSSLSRGPESRAASIAAPTPKCTLGGLARLLTDIARSGRSPSPTPEVEVSMASKLLITSTPCYQTPGSRVADSVADRGDRTQPV